MGFSQSVGRIRGSRKWKVGRLVAGAAVSVGLGWAVLQGLDWSQVFETFRTFPISNLLLGVLAFLGSMILRAYRWYVLLVKEKVTLFRLFLVQNTGIGLNNVSPVRMVSEPIQLAMVTRRYGLSGGTALATLVTEHVLDIFATAVLMGLGVLIITELRGASIQLIGALILFVVTLLVLLVVARGTAFIPFIGRMPFIVRFGDKIRTIQRAPGRLLLSFLATVGHWVLLGVSGWVLGRGLGMDVSLWTMVVLFLAATFFTSAVPSLPGAVGTFEAAIMYTLVTLLSVDSTLAFPFAVVMHLVLFLPSTAIALVMLIIMWREGVRLRGEEKPREPAVAAISRASGAPDRG